MKEILYRINDDPIQVFTGDNGTFILNRDGENHFIEYWAIDNAGNEETPHHTFTIDIDKRKPNIDLVYEVYSGGNPLIGWELGFYATAFDDVSGIDRVEFYLNNELKETIYGPGPSYYWECYYRYNGELKVEGLICGREITDDYVKFFDVIVTVGAIIDPEGPFDISAYAYDKAGNRDSDIIIEPRSKETITPGIYLFQSITLPNNYVGKIGLFFINAIFNVTIIEDASVSVKGTSDQIKVVLLSGGDNYGDGYVIADDVTIWVNGTKVSSYTTEIWIIGGEIFLGLNGANWEEDYICPEGDYEVTVSIKNTVVFDGTITVG